MIVKDKKYILKQFKDIKIEDFEFNKNLEVDKIGKSNFILKSAGYYKYKLTSEQIDLIDLINNIRIKYNIPKLNYSIEEKLPDFILNEYANEYTELFLDENKNIFKISKNEYLFRYSKDHFKKELTNKNPEIVNIISKDTLNKIIIIEQRNNEFILISGNPSNSSEQNPKIEIKEYNLNFGNLNSENDIINLSAFRGK